MQRFLLRRLLLTIVTLWLVSVLIFFMARISGDPTTLLIDDYASASTLEELRASLGLDKSYPEQYWIFLKNAVRGDFGISIVQKQPVGSLIMQRLPATLYLGLVAFAFSLVVGIPLGVLSSLKRGSVMDQVGKIVALIGQSAPPFWIGIMLMFFFAVRLGWVAPSGREEISSIVLPAITLGWFNVAANLRLMRSAMLDVMDTEYIKLARAKGVSQNIIIWKHALRNALIPPLTFAGITLGGLITGSLVAETVFAWPGLGQLAFLAVRDSDYPLLQGVVLSFAAAYLATAFLVDVFYAYVDPRIRFS
ncbi:MAG: ABC transporter permease [Chloroflexi bacterium]|nr:ABC transporter permease [Chloroflexota bacterium]